MCRVDSSNLITSGGLAACNSYSTEEHFTSKYWIDGKKIYQKTFIGKTANEQSYSNIIRYSRTLLAENIAFLVSSSGMIDISTTTNDPLYTQINESFLDWTIRGGIDILARVNFNLNTKEVNLYLEEKYNSICQISNRDYTVSLEYTKTTD